MIYVIGTQGCTELTKLRYISQLVYVDLDRMCMLFSQMGERRYAHKT
jgi:hypothetical protein